MALILLLVLIVAITCFSLFGSWYARKFNTPAALIALYTSFLILSQIIAVKIATFDLGFTTVFVPAATIIFAVTFLLTDIVNERFGRFEVYKMIFIAFIAQVMMVLFIWIATAMDPAPFWPHQESWEKIFSLNWRITLASWVTFLVSENFDAYVFYKFRKLTKGRHLWMRNAFSSLPALAIDSVLFVSLAFYGLLPLLPIILGQITIKWLVGIIDIPFMYLNRAILGKPLGEYRPPVSL